MRAYHHPGIAVFSSVVAILASYVALDLAGSVAAAQALGTGLWAMHFVATLAFYLPAPIAYEIPVEAF